MGVPALWSLGKSSGDRQIQTVELWVFSAVRKQKQHRGAAPAHTARQHRGGFALMSRVGDGADCNQWLTEADNAGA